MHPPDRVVIAASGLDAGHVRAAFMLYRRALDKRGAPPAEVIDATLGIGTYASAPELGPWLTRAEAARYAQVTTSTIDRWRRAGTIDTRRIGGRVLIHRASLDGHD